MKTEEQYLIKKWEKCGQARFYRGDLVIDKLSREKEINEDYPTCHIVYHFTKTNREWILIHRPFINWIKYKLHWIPKWARLKNDT